MKKLLSIACLMSVQHTFGGTLIVLNKSDATASLVDLKTFQIVATVNTGIGPHEVAISPDGKKAVVSNYGNKEAGNTLTIIDLVKARSEGEIKLGKYTHPHGISFLGNNELVVTAEDQRCILRINLFKKRKLLKRYQQVKTYPICSQLMGPGSEFLLQILELI